MKSEFTSEADLVQAFLDTLNHRHGEGRDWTVYPETADWDLLLVHKDGFQLGIQAKLTLNAKAIDQALAGASSYWTSAGPDYRAVLVPKGGKQLHLERICKAIGIGIITVRKPAPHELQYVSLPKETGYTSGDWPNWCPAERCKLPDYIPDVTAGVKSPVQLTDWKIKAIRLLIVLERRGYVTRDDMKRIQISPTRWCDNYHGMLARGERGYVRCSRTPDLRAQHPTNYVQIEADADEWIKSLGLAAMDAAQQGVLI